MAGDYDASTQSRRTILVDPTTGAKITNPTTLQITPAITTTSTQYSANDVVGGELTLSGAVRANGGAAILQSLLVIDRANQKAPLTILIFDADPAGTYTDNAACPALGSDAPKLKRKINVAASDYETVGGVAIADIAAISKVVKSAATTNLWAVAITTGTPTYGANSTDLSISFGILPD